MGNQHFYFSASNNADWFNIAIEPIPGNADFCDCVTFDFDKLNAAVCLLSSLRQMLWATWKKTYFAPKNYWWVTTENKSWLKTIKVKEGGIAEEKDCWNMPFNYFESEEEAKKLKENIEKLFEIYGFSLSSQNSQL